MSRITVSILGASGYTAREALKILVRHPGVEIVELVSRREPAPTASELHGELAGFIDKECTQFDAERLAENSDVVFSCLPHRESFKFCGKLVERGCRVVDLSADYRFQNVDVYKQYYDVEHEDVANLEKAVYGLPELYRERIRGAELVANPGCYPTAVILAALPMVKAGYADSKLPIIVSAISGASGAGRKVIEGLMFCSVNENVNAYRVGVHQHAPEMKAILTEAGEYKTEVLFTPHLAPIDRGILATVYVPLKTAPENMTAHYEEYYSSEPFVRVCPEGTWPQTKHVAFTNQCAVGVTKCGNYAVIVSAIDNLVKGASGQAIQNMNIMFGLDEKAGLI